MQPTRRNRIRSSRRYLAPLAVIAILTICFNVFVYIEYLDDSAGVDQFKSIVLDSDRPEMMERPTKREPGRKLAHLTCKQYGNTNQEVVDDMVYWYDIPSDQDYLNPFQEIAVNSDVEQFLLFEQDSAGFNNRRMSIETILTMGISMGRTMVLPPEQPIYLWKTRGKRRHRFSFEDFFPLEAAQLEHFGMKIITMKEFLEKVLKEGLLKDRESGFPTFPPNNRTDWNDANESEMNVLHTWLKGSSFPIAGWDSNRCISVWSKDAAINTTLLDTLTQQREKVNYRDSPVAVNSSALDRFDELRAGRNQLCQYDKTMQEQQFLYFGHTYDMTGNRFLSPFYTFHFYEDWNEALWMRRFVRDHLRYHDELFCAAARVVDALRERVRKRGLPGNPDGAFSTMHVRRGDFAVQFKQQIISIDQIYLSTKDILKPNSTVFIATDDKNKAYFEVLRQHYDICFLDDFADEIKSLNSNLFGIIDQIIASKGDIFFGTALSTLTAYANRLRGYYSIRDKLPGYELGKLQSFHFAKEGRDRTMTEYFAPSVPLWSLEFPMGWRDIDHGIPEIP